MCSWRTAIAEMPAPNTRRPQQPRKAPLSLATAAYFGAMSRARPRMHDLDAVVGEPRVPRQPWVELSCLLCGETVGILLERRIIRPRAPSSVRLDDQTLRCGRCGGPVITGERGRDVLRDEGGPARQVK
jgi:hypothetical protein